MQESRAYDPAGRLASVTNVKGTQTNYTYYGNNQLASSYVVCSACSGGKQNVTTYGYDAAGNRVTETDAGRPDRHHRLSTPTTRWSRRRWTRPGSNRTVAASYDADGNVVTKTLTGGGVTQTADDHLQRDGPGAVADGGQLRREPDQPATRGTSAAWSPRRPTRRATSRTISNDEAGRPVVETGPAVPSQTGDGGAPVTANPVSMIGYDTFGDQTESSDPDGNVTDLRLRPGRPPGLGHRPVLHPARLQHAGQRHHHDGLQQPRASRPTTTDPLGNITQFSYDQLGDLASQTDPDGGVTTYTLRPGRRADQRHRPHRGADPGHLRQPRPPAHRDRPGPAEHLRRLHHHLRLQRRRRPDLADQPDRGADHRDVRRRRREDL